MGYKDRLRQRAYQTEFKKRRRAEFIRDKSCVRCGSTDRLEIDHIDPSTKKVPINSLWTSSLKKRLPELQKCQVLCFSCHVEKTASERRGKPGYQRVLNEDDVRKIRTMISEGLGIRAISRNFGVHHSTVISLRDGETWAWVV